MNRQILSLNLWRIWVEVKGFLLDTNIWIGLAKREQGLLARLAGLSPSQVFSCSVVRGELFSGARKSQRVESNLEGFGRLLLPYQSVPFDDEAAGHYGLIRAVLEKAGTPIGANDLQIAAIALRWDFVLVTRNHREFLRVPSLRVEEW
jgi:tRNA(fMet)-specific endonuclease VapC